MLRMTCIAVALCVLLSYARAATLPETVIPQSCGVQLKANNHDPANLDLIRDAGFKFVRRGFIWANVEKQEGVYDFREYDSLVKDAEDRGLGILACIALNNEKIYGHVKDDRGREAYARYAAALAGRYKGRNILWELWNEPNIASFWGKHGTANTESFADEYVNLVKATVPAMKKADPDCFVMAGSVSGLWYASFEWQGFCFSKGILTSGIDAWSVHPYAFKCPEDYVEAYAKVRKMMRDAGLTTPLPLLNSERGYPLGKAEGYAGGDDRLSREYQAWHLVRQYLVDLSCDIKLTSWYEWTGREGFSLLDPGNAETHALTACKVMIWQLSGYRLDKRLPLASSRDFVLRFINPAGAAKIVAWTAPPPEQSPDTTRPHEVTLPVEVSGQVNVCQLYGDEASLQATDGNLKLTLTAAPQYITVKPDPGAPPKPVFKKHAPLVASTTAPVSDPGLTTELKLFEKGVTWQFAKAGGAGAFAVATEDSRRVGVFDFDFTGGGTYIVVTAPTDLPQGTTSLWVKARSAIAQRVTLRVYDSTGQCHQFKGGVAGTGAWETIRMPLTTRLEHWDGANDGVIHFPIKAVSLLLPSPAGDVKKGKITFTDLHGVAGPAEAQRPAPVPAIVAPTVPPPSVDSDGRMNLKLFEKSAKWNFAKAGAAGGFSLGADGDKRIGIINFDFTTGGPYVVAKVPTNIPANAAAITFAARGSIAQRFTLRIYDQTGQCHMFRGNVDGTSQWQTFQVPLNRKMEHFDGANDGVIHYPIQTLGLAVPAPTGGTKAGKIELADFSATAK